MGNRLARHIAPLALWTGLCLLFFSSILLGSEHLPSSDFSGQFHAFGLFQAREMLQGRWPLWSPGSYGGVPFAADPQSATWYPLRWLTILLSSRSGLSYYALELEGLAHIWLCGLFTYLLAYDITKRRAAALFAAVAFGLGGYLTSYPLLQLAVLETITWLPLILYLVRRGVRSVEDNPVRGSTTAPAWLCAAALAIALAEFAGHTQTLLHIIYLTLAYYIYLAHKAHWPWRRVLGYGLAAAGATAGLSAVGWLPALRYALSSTRGQLTYTQIAAGEPLQNYIQMLFPGTLSKWAAEYGGLSVLLTVVCAWKLRRQGDRSEVLFWVSVCVLSAWLALGDAGVLFQGAYYVLPGFALFRQQERLLGILALSLALLAAQGLALWQGSEPQVRRKALVSAALDVLAAMAAAAIMLALMPNLVDANWPMTMLRQFGVLLIMAAGVWAAGRWRWGAVALVILLAGDLYLNTLASVDRQPGTPAVYWPVPAWLDTVREAEPARIDSQYLVYANLGEIYGLEDIVGISPLQLKAWGEMAKLPTLVRWKLLNVRYILAKGPIGGAPLTQVAEIDAGVIPDRPLSGIVYRYDDALPRAWLVYKARQVDGPAAALEALAEPDFDPALEGVFSGDVPALPEAAAGAWGTARSERLSSSELRVNVDTPQTGWLIVSEWSYAGWQAYVDGQQATLYTADYGLQAVYLEAGQHTVRLVYRPWDVYAGAAVSLGALAVVGFILARCRGRSKKAREGR